MGTWSITSNTVGYNPTINNSGIATFPKNSGDTQVICTITYVDDNGCSATTTFTIPSGCSSCGCEVSWSEGAIMGVLSNNKAGIRIMNVSHNGHSDCGANPMVQVSYSYSGDYSGVVNGQLPYSQVSGTTDWIFQPNVVLANGEAISGIFTLKMGCSNVLSKQITITNGTIPTATVDIYFEYSDTQEGYDTCSIYNLNGITRIVSSVAFKENLRCIPSAITTTCGTWVGEVSGSEGTLFSGSTSSVANWVHTDKAGDYTNVEINTNTSNLPSYVEGVDGNRYFVIYSYHYGRYPIRH